MHSAEIDVPAGTMMHDFMITRDHAIFMDLPIVFDLSNLESPLGWDDTYGARIGIMPRMGTNDGHPLVRDRPVLRVPPPQRLRGRQRGGLRCRSSRVDVDATRGRHPTGVLHRWTFDLASGAVNEEQTRRADARLLRVSTTGSSAFRTGTAGV